MVGASLLCACLAGTHAAVARATIVSMSSNALMLSLKAAISPHLLQQGACLGSSSQLAARACWRVDRDDVSSVFVRMRQSLLGRTLLPHVHGRGMLAYET